MSGAEANLPDKFSDLKLASGPEEYLTYKLGDFKLDSGEVLPHAYIAYKTFGDSKNPAIIYPTWFSGLISDNVWLISTTHEGLNPSKYFIIIPAIFGNGQSTSPSNTPSLRHSFPAVTVADNVRAQYALVTTHLGIKHARAVLGWSMGAGQSYQWAVSYPDFMDVIVPFCGAAKTALHNCVFLEGEKTALVAARGWRSAGVGKGVVCGDDKINTWSEEQKDAGLRAFGRGYAGWGFSQAFYREKYHEKYFGAKDLEDFLVNFWEKWALSKDPDNLITMLQTWQLGDISASPKFGGDLRAALRSIKAKCLVMPGKTDLYFPPEDSQFEVENMAPGIGTYLEIPSIWGHWAGAGDAKEDVKFLDQAIANFLKEN
ncbi:homoserine acetyltransferase family protein [Xylogone sp. PMI_703]|nr:homoserine acetyltransferase family protein [Xylogone sp. PMI_703]